MSKEEVLDALKQLADETDSETAHAEADRILTAFLQAQGFAEIAAAYDAVTKWYA